MKFFCKVLEVRFRDVRTGFGKAYLRLLIDEVRLEGNELKIRGSYARLMPSLTWKKKKLGELPSFIRDWRARQDLNPRPPGS